MIDKDFIDDPDAPPSEDEKRLADELRRALEDANETAVKSEAADLARALKHAHAPSAIDAIAHRAIVARAIDRGFKQRRGNVVRVTFGVAALVAAAAAIVLLLGKVVRPSDAPLTLAVARSTEALFPDPFPRQGGESQRIDRIAVAPASDLRENRFAQWGVR